MIPSILTKISFLILGIEIQLIVLKKEAEAGGTATVVLVLFGRISTECIHIIERKPGLMSIGEIRNEMKIRPVEFFEFF